jgi:hypothetical protein
MRTEAHQRLVGPDPYRATEFGLGSEQQIRISGHSDSIGGLFGERGGLLDGVDRDW